MNVGNIVRAFWYLRWAGFSPGVTLFRSVCPRLLRLHQSVFVEIDGAVTHGAAVTGLGHKFRTALDGWVFSLAFRSACCSLTFCRPQAPTPTGALPAYRVTF